MVEQKIGGGWKRLECVPANPHDTYLGTADKVRDTLGVKEPVMKVPDTFAVWNSDQMGMIVACWKK